MWEWMEKKFGYDVLLWFQSWRTDWVSAIFRPFDWVGTEIFFIVLIAIIYWTIDKRKGRIIAAVFLFSVWFNSFVKVLCRRPRPFQVTVFGKDQVMEAFIAPTSYGLPSGHTMSTVSFFSMLSYKFKNVAVLTVSILLMILVPFSRLVHGMHYPQDIILGYLLSFIIFFAWIYLEKPIFTLIEKLRKGFLLLILFSIFLVMFFLPFVTLQAGESPFVVLEDSMMLSILFLGGMLGMVVENSYIQFDSKGPFWKRGLRILVGLFFLVLIGATLDFAFKPVNQETHAFFHFSGNFIENFLLSFWITAGAPAIFRVFGLADREFSPKKKVLVK